jgi:hypothetical protein
MISQRAKQQSIRSTSGNARIAGTKAHTKATRLNDTSIRHLPLRTNLTAQPEKLKSLVQLPTFIEIS